MQRQSQKAAADPAATELGTSGSTKRNGRPGGGLTSDSNARNSKRRGRVGVGAMAIVSCRRGFVVAVMALYCRRDGALLSP